MSVVDAPEEKTEPARGKGRGSKFMVLGKQNYAKLLSASTSNRLNFVITYLVLLAGTGADHQHTRWSTKACEEKVGIGKPRAKLAIAELVQAGLISLSADYTAMRPRYEMVPPSDELDEIFLPIQLVTGLAGEPSVLRRVRETKNFLSLRILIACYQDAQLDGTYGVSVSCLSSTHARDFEVARKVIERGAFTLWSLAPTEVLQVDPGWVTKCTGVSKPTPELYELFWDAVKLLRTTGAIVVETWMYDSSDATAEPIFPSDTEGLFSGQKDSVTDLTTLVYSASDAMLGSEYYLRDQHPDGFLVPLPSHCSEPCLRGVIKVRVEPDTPGCRLSFRRRISIIDHFSVVLNDAIQHFIKGDFSRPYSLSPHTGRKADG